MLAHPCHEIYPCLLCFGKDVSGFLCIIIIFPNIAELEGGATVPLLVREVGTVHQALLVGVVRHLDATLLLIGQVVEDSGILLRVSTVANTIQVVIFITEQVTALVGNKHGTRVELHSITSIGVVGSRSTQIGLERIVPVCDTGVIAVLGRGNVQLKVHIVDTDRIIGHGILTSRRAIVEDKAIIELEVHIAGGVAVVFRGSTLSLNADVGSVPAVHSATRLINLSDRTSGNSVLLASGHSRDCHKEYAAIGILRVQQFRRHLATRI